MTMRLERIVPARKKTLIAEWCREFVTMSPQFRAIRERCRNPMTSCKWCGHAIADGEKLYLACIKGSGNVALCRTCGEQLIASEETHVCTGS